MIAMRSLFRSLSQQVAAGWARTKQWVVDHKHPLGFAAIVCVMFVMPHIAHAGPMEEAISAITKILSWVVQMLGSLFVFLVDIFLGFARYNGFGDAQPVRLGWVVVRDICNMFFIVVLLISAFSTILGYDSSLRYNAVLPKLLLMAILINFSRTFIQILIDFSQVVTLTFVNAFRAAGAGNFTAAFRINQLLSMRSDYEASQGTELGAQIFTSFLLALVLIVIANGVMLIMIAYTLGRIVLLWVLLIFSPLAFLTSALPGSLQSALSGFAGKYWSRLAGALTGGPVVMFMIYLTFAILQTPPPTTTNASPAATPAATGQSGSTPALSGQSQGLSSQLGLYEPTADINGTSAATTFINRVGTSDNVASFIVAVALMLLALETAMESAKAVDQTIGNFASKIGSASKGLAFGAASLAAASPFIAAKILGKGAFNAVDRRYDITGKASGLALRATNRIPLLGQYARKPLMAGMTMRKREAEKEASEINSALKGMTADQKRVVQKGYNSVLGGAVGAVADKAVSMMPEGRMRDAASSVRKAAGGAWYTQGDKQAAMAIAEDLRSDSVMAEERRRLEDEFATSIQRDSMFEHIENAGHAGKMADALADDRLLQEERRNLDAEYLQAERVGDVAAIEKVKKRRKENPLLMSSEDKFASDIESKVQNPTKFAKMDESAKANVKVLVQALKAAGVVDFDADGGVRLTGDDAKKESYLNSLKDEDKTMFNNTHTVLDFLENNEFKGKKGMDLKQAQRSRLETDQYGNMRMWRNPDSSLKADELKKEVADGLLMRSTKESNAYQALDSASKAGTLNTAAAGNALGQFLQAGGQFVDLDGKNGIPNIEQALNEYTKSLVPKFNTLLQFKDGQLQVRKGQEKAYQDLTSELRYLMSQPGKRGVSKKMAEHALDAMQVTLTVDDLDNPGSQKTEPLANIAVYKATNTGANSMRTKKAMLEFFSTAVDLDHAPTLQTAQDLHNSTDRQTRARIATQIDRAFDTSSST